jgi:hypothetical protein
MSTRTKKHQKVNRTKEVDRILKDNVKRGLIAKEDVYFAKKFLSHIISEQEDLPEIGQDLAPLSANREASPEKFTSDQNQVDLEKSLDSETDPSSFDVDGGSKDAESFSNVYVKKCHHWVKKIEEFTEWLNGIERSDSLNKELNEADRDGSVFKGITRKVGDNIAKTAGELSRLAQALSKVVVDAPKKQRELQKLTKIT